MLLPLIFVAGFFFSVLRLYFIIPAKRTRTSRRREHSSTCGLAVFLGGHTREALMLISALDFRRYSPRTYIFSEGDTLSAQQAIALETLKVAELSSQNIHQVPNQYKLLTIPRARRVHQSLLTTPPTSLISLLMCVYHITVAPILFPKTSRFPFADVLILNGPGTCFVLCVAIYINKFFGLPCPRVIYVESFARVQSLSLSGKLLRPLVDRFVVQWRELLRDQGREECRGLLV